MVVFANLVRGVNVLVGHISTFVAMKLMLTPRGVFGGGALSATVRRRIEIPLTLNGRNSEDRDMVATVVWGSWGETVQ